MKLAPCIQKRAMRLISISSARTYAATTDRPKNKTAVYTSDSFSRALIDDSIRLLNFGYFAAHRSTGLRDDGPVKAAFLAAAAVWDSATHPMHQPSCQARKC